MPEVSDNSGPTISLMPPTSIAGTESTPGGPVKVQLANSGSITQSGQIVTATLDPSSPNLLASQEFLNQQLAVVTAFMGENELSDSAEDESGDSDPDATITSTGDDEYSITNANGVTDDFTVTAQGGSVYDVNDVTTGVDSNVHVAQSTGNTYSISNAAGANEEIQNALTAGDLYGVSESTGANDETVSELNAGNFLAASGTQGTGGTQGTDGSTKTTSKGNPWLAGSMFIAAQVAMMEVFRALRTAKANEVKIQVNSNDLVFAQAQNSAATIISQAQVQKTVDMCSAICSGISAGAAGLSAGISIGGAFKTFNLGAKQDALGNKPTEDNDEETYAAQNQKYEAWQQKQNNASDPAKFAKKNPPPYNPNRERLPGTTDEGKQDVTGYDNNGVQSKNMVRRSLQERQAGWDRDNSAITREQNKWSAIQTSIQAVTQTLQQLGSTASSAEKAATDVAIAQYQASKVTYDALQQLYSKQLDTTSSAMSDQTTQMGSLVSDLQTIMKERMQTISNLLGTR